MAAAGEWASPAAPHTAERGSAAAPPPRTAPSSRSAWWSGRGPAAPGAPEGPSRSRGGGVSGTATSPRYPLR